MRTSQIRLHAGEVIELEIDGQAETALVLLATHDCVILDRCDGSMPIVASTAELSDVRTFRPDRRDIAHAV